MLSLAHTAAVHFGDVPDPVSGDEGQPNLPAAQQMIDILSLLDEKTRGNLTAEERQLLEQVLFELRMRYRRGDDRHVRSVGSSRSRASSFLEPELSQPELRPASRFSAPARRPACR